MLKLMKYEIRSIWWLYVTSGALVLAMAGISRLIWLFLPEDPERLVWSILPYTVFTGLTVFFIIAASVLAYAIPAVRFYQTVLKDQAYLTFTLPVRRSEVYFSKLFTGAAGLVFSALISVGGALIAFAGTEFGGVLADIAEVFPTLLFSDELSGGQIAVSCISAVLSVLHYLFGMTSVLFCAMCIGQLASGNKLLYSILSFVGINTVSSAISSFFLLITEAVFLNGVQENDALSAMSVSSLLTVLPSVLVSAGCIIAADLILKKHLNLE